MSLSDFRVPCRGLAAALALLAPALAGCSALPSMPSMPSMPSWFNSSAANANASVATATTEWPAGSDCPPVQIRTGASTLTSSAKPAEPTAMNLRYQVTIATTARECRMGPDNTVSIKVGVQGRVIIGPEGAGSNSIDVPLRFAVVRETMDSKVITTKLDRVAVVVPLNEGNVLFSHVAESLEFPMPRGGDLDNYVVYIGFDPASVQAIEKKPRPRQKPTPKSGQS